MAEALGFKSAPGVTTTLLRSVQLQAHACMASASSYLWKGRCTGTGACRNADDGNLRVMLSCRRLIDLGCLMSPSSPIMIQAP